MYSPDLSIEKFTLWSNSTEGQFDSGSLTLFLPRSISQRLLTTPTPLAYTDWIYYLESIPSPELSGPQRMPDHSMLAVY